MLTPISNAHPVDVRTIDARQVSQTPSQAKPDPRAQTPPVQKSGEVSHDQVTLKSAGQPDNDGDRR
jgi:hypothetical protein